MLYSASSFYEILHIVVLLTVEAVALVFLFRLSGGRAKLLLGVLGDALRRRKTAPSLASEPSGAEVSPDAASTEMTADHDDMAGLAAAPAQRPNGKQSRKDFLRQIIMDIGGHSFDAGEERQRLVIGYQGAVFVLDYEEDSPWVHLCMPRIEEIALTDIDKVSDTRKAINDENCRPYFWNLIYTIDAEDRKMNIHLASYFLLKPDMPDVGSIVEAYLNGAFRRQRGFLLTCERLAAEKAELE